MTSDQIEIEIVQEIARAVRLPDGELVLTAWGDVWAQSASEPDLLDIEVTRQLVTPEQVKSCGYDWRLWAQDLMEEAARWAA